MMKKLKNLIALSVVIVLAALLLACDTGSLSQTITFDKDFSGSRQIVLELSATPVTDADNKETNVTYPGLKGLPYYRIRKHGNDLQTYLDNILKADSYTKDYDWTVVVDDQTIQSTNPSYPKLSEGKEYIKITFEFDNFFDYTTKLRALASFGGASLHYSRESVSFDYEDPTLKVDVDAKTAHYFEHGGVTKFLYSGIWKKMIEDPQMVTLGTCYHSDGTAFTVQRGNSKDDLFYDGIKAKGLSLTANGSTRTLTGLVQADGTNQAINGNTHYDTDVVLSGSVVWQDFFTGPVTIDGNTATYTGGNPNFRWYLADANGNKTGEPLTTSASYTHTFDANNTPVKIVGIEGTAKYIKTFTPPQIVKWTVSFLDWDDTVLATVEVEDGQGVPANKVPANPGMRDDGQVFKNWDKGYSNITSNTTVRAVYGEGNVPVTPEEGGCGGSIAAGSVGLFLGVLGLFGAGIILKRRHIKEQ